MKARGAMGVDLYDHDVIDLSADGVDTAVSAVDDRVLPIWTHRAKRSLSARPDWDGSR